MKILFLTSSLAPCYGGAALSESILSGKLSIGHEVLVLSRRTRLDFDFAKSKGIRKIRAFSPVSVLYAFLNPCHEINHLIRSSDVFHLNGHWYWENYFFARLCKRHQVPYVLHPRGMLWLSYRRPYLKKAFNFFLGNWIVSNASKIILLSNYEKTQVDNYPLEAKNLVIIPNGIDVESQPKQPTQTKKYFLYLGRLEPRKNLEFLIRSFKVFNGMNKTIALRLVGPVERNYDIALAKLIAELNLEDYVSIDGPVYGPEKESLLGCAEAVIYPAIGEPFGRTVFEAFAAGTLCLTPERSGGAEYVGRFAPLMLYPDDSEKILAEKMLTVVGLSQNERNKITELARSWINMNLNWVDITKKVEQTYQMIIEGSAITA